MANIYIDESGSINNKLKGYKDFKITLIIPTREKELQRAYKRFVSKNFIELKRLSNNRKMFSNEKFQELKGSEFDINMKKEFANFFTYKKHFEMYYIRIRNKNLSDNFCKNTARGFNYVICLALKYFIQNNLILDDAKYYLQLDERNEKTETKFFLENYLMTELNLSGITNAEIKVSYFDSANSNMIQIADVFSNIFYSHLLTGNYEKEMNLLKEKGILKFIYEFPYKKDRKNL